MALIELNDVSRQFTMGREVIRALDHVSVKIEQGEFVAIIGPSGSGKSTMMNLIGLLDRPDVGVFMLDGQPVQDLTDDQRSLRRSQKIGFVFQSFHLLPRISALRNVELPLVYSAAYDQQYSPANARKKAEAALKRVGLGDRMDHKPNELSGGQRQRVAIARAIVNEPSILLADEPTGNLDSNSGLEILNLFEELNKQGVTLVLVTHDPKIAARARRTIEMLDGKVVSDHANR